MLTDKEKFPYFTEVIERYFVNNYDRIRAKLSSLTHLDSKVMKTFIWNHSVSINYTDLITKYDNLYEILKNKKFSDVKTSVHKKKTLEI